MYDILDAVGGTPLVRLCGFEREYGLGAHVYAKLESLEPFGSIKDRAAKRIIEDAEGRGELRRGMTIIEATSGNMGISLAAIARARGDCARIIMPENMSEARTRLIRAYGAELVLTDADGGMAASLTEVERACLGGGYYWTRQFENRSGVDAHKWGTAREIDRALRGRVDAVICGIGTGATAMGIAEHFRGRGAEVYGVEPSGSPYLSLGSRGRHSIQGIGAGFLPPLLDLSALADVIRVTDDAASQRCAELVGSDGLLVGLSSGAAADACLQLCRSEAWKNKNIVLIFADGGERYL